MNLKLIRRVSDTRLFIQSDRGPGGDQNISWNGQSQAQPPTSQAPPTQTGSNSAGALSTGSDWNRPSESHSGITWGGSKMILKSLSGNIYGVF